ncbi:acyl-CoA N-acyltransferase [Aspergillus carlsbadensis]|nr:acyl-CoA N-acyltransferase [Aspergillus carlsbadensis]
MAAEENHSSKTLPLNLALPKSGCHIRPLTHTNPTDAPSLAHHANNPLITKWMRDAFPNPYTLESAKFWITFTEAQSPKLDFAICTTTTTSENESTSTSTSTSTVIGGIGLKQKEDIYRRTLEIGYWIGEAHWGKGIASEALEEFVRWVFSAEEFAHVGRLEAEAFEGNTGSFRVLEKVGFKPEGRKRAAVEKAGVVLDVFVFGLLKEEFLDARRG